MGNEQVGQIPLLLKIGQQIQHLCPDGHIQRGNGLVRNDEVRLHNQRSGDANPLTLAAGKLVGKPDGKLGQKAHVGQCFRHLRLPLLLGQTVAPGIKSFTDNIVHLGTFVQ